MLMLDATMATDANALFANRMWRVEGCRHFAGNLS